jgi:hypothetical protein
VSLGNEGGSNGGGCIVLVGAASRCGAVPELLTLKLREGNMLLERGANAEGWRSDISFGGNSRSDGRLGRGGGSFLSVLPSRAISCFRPPLSSVCAGFMLSFCRRSRKASMPSFGSEVVGSGGALFACCGNFGRAGNPILRVDMEEARDVVEATDVRSLEMLPTLRELPCVPDRLCPFIGPSCDGILNVLEVLGRRSDLPSNGPGAMLSNRFVMLFPPSIRGLSGANRGLGSTYRCCGVGSILSRGCGVALWGVALRLDGNGGKAQSRFEGRVGDGGASLRRGTGVVTLLFILKGDLGGADDGRGERLLGSL